MEKKKLISCMLLLFTILYYPVFAIENDSTKQNTYSPKEYTMKGHWMIGPTFSFNVIQSDHDNLFIATIDNIQTSSFSVKVDGAYAFKNNTFAGLGLYYSRSLTSGIYENNKNELFDQKIYTNSYSVRPFIKNLMPLDKNGRFNLVSQVEMWYQLNQLLSQKINNGDYSRTLSRTHDILLGFRPGINVFIMKNMAVETTLNVAGVKYSYSTSHTTNQPTSHTHSASFDLKIDILQINLGVFVYL